jgi:ABC-2 type transport system permease protein
VSVAARSAELGRAGVTVAPSRGRSLLALVAWGLREQRRAPLTLGGPLGAMSALMAAIWPSIEEATQTFVRSYPSGLKEAFGIQRLDSVEAYVDAEMLSLIVPLALAIFAVRCATRATVGAEDRGELDTLLSVPVSRRALVVGSLVATALVLALILAVIWALT